MNRGFKMSIYLTDNNQIAFDFRLVPWAARQWFYRKRRLCNTVRRLWISLEWRRMRQYTPLYLWNAVGLYCAALIMMTSVEAVNIRCVLPPCYGILIKVVNHIRRYEIILTCSDAVFFFAANVSDRRRQGRLQTANIADDRLQPPPKPYLNSLISNIH